ncbi:MAG: hypothetical protein PHO00_04620, partial [bacterium]|nr:hypothetical protein [bacterium]
HAEPSIVNRGNAAPLIVNWENAAPSIENRGNAALRIVGGIFAKATILMYGFSVCIVAAGSKVKIKRKSKNATIIRPKYNKKGVRGWLEKEGIKIKGNKVVLYKRVSSDYKTQEGNSCETHWGIGKTLEHHDWRPEAGECGAGKFHACSRPYFADEFRSKIGDRYVAIEIHTKDLYAWEKPLYHHKIAFRKGKVLFECDRVGRKK